MAVSEYDAESAEAVEFYAELEEEQVALRFESVVLAKAMQLLMPVWIAVQPRPVPVPSAADGSAGGGGATDIGQVSEARRRMYLYPIEAGHYLSDEPGFYLEGKFGIRIEADLIVVEQPTHFAWGARCPPLPPPPHTHRLQ